MSRDAAATQAVGHIQDLIRRGEVRAGEKLPSERELARILGVSRSTLREAIRALIVMNILVARHGDGTYVSSLEPEVLSAPFTFALDDQQRREHAFRPCMPHRDLDRRLAVAAEPVRVVHPVEL